MSSAAVAPVAAGVITAEEVTEAAKDATGVAEEATGAAEVTTGAAITVGLATEDVLTTGLAVVDGASLAEEVVDR